MILSIARLILMCEDVMSRKSNVKLSTEGVNDRVKSCCNGLMHNTE